MTCQATATLRTLAMSTASPILAQLSAMSIHPVRAMTCSTPRRVGRAAWQAAGQLKRACDRAQIVGDSHSHLARWATHPRCGSFEAG